ncbi:MAG: serine/threonine-protein kinase [Acidobacteriota bacterium]
MPGDRFQEIEELFHAASELEGHERQAFLDRECADDSELRQEVSSLLRFGTDSATRIGAAITAAEPPGRELDDPRAGEHLGPYRLLEILGRGGLSTVYLAERDDGQFRKRVAVKVIRRELDSRELRQRQRLERQILASLEHPNIARLLDGGTSAAGLPYFVMEYVEGQDLESYCNDRQLPVRARIDLFRQVCTAVDYAHRNLVIHRDIKPANILVTAEGVPKLLDFGIAKPLESVFEPSMVTTAPGLRFLTLPFASPEQIRGEHLTTATDVYSLGVVLYRLLTGAHPYPLQGARPAEVERLVGEATPEKPSQAIGHRQHPHERRLRQRLVGDLDTITLKALRKEPERRYSSARLLADDLRNHLEGLPVDARRDTLTYRLGKFLLRHRLVAAAMLVIASIIALYSLRLAAERDRARRAAVQAEQVSETMIGLFESSDPTQTPGETITAREVLERGAAQIRQDLTDQPLVLANMMAVMGRVYYNLGLYQAAQPLLRDALALRLEHLNERHLDVASSRVYLGETLVATGDFETAADFFQQALTVQRKALGHDHNDTLLSLNNLAVTKAYQGDLETAAEFLWEVLERRQRTLGPEHPDVAGTLNNLADTLDRNGDSKAAEPLYRRALAIKRKNLGPDHPDVTLVLNNLARLNQRRGNLAAARQLYQEALAINRRVLPATHPDVTYGLYQLAQLERRDGRLDEAETLARQGLEIQRQAPGASEVLLTRWLDELAETLLAQDRPTAAETLLAESLERRQRLRPNGHWRIAVVRSLLGACHAATGRTDTARPLLESGHAQLLAEFGADDPRTEAAQRRLQNLELRSQAP